MVSNFVDVWHGCLLQSREDIDGLSVLMSEQEKLKADTFKHCDMRRRYVAVRATLRRVLAGYLSSDPAALEFNVSEHGKPYLVCGSIHFNLSHTANHLLIAVANFPDIGIDIEEIKSRVNFDGLAARCFSTRELQTWRRLSLDEQQQTFYRLWVKKEAFVKAVGRGLALGLDQCEVELAADGQLLVIPSAYGVATDWLMTEMAIDSAVQAALATRSCQYDLRLMSLDNELSHAAKF